LLDFLCELYYDARIHEHQGYILVQLLLLSNSLRVFCCQTGFKLTEAQTDTFYSNMTGDLHGEGKFKQPYVLSS